MQRPRSLAILVILQILQAAGLLAYSIYMARVFGWGFHTREVQILQVAPFEVFEVASSGTLYLILAVITLFLAGSLWMLKPWAWLASMTLQGFSLFAALYGYLRHHPNYISMALGILLVFYLNQRDVQAVFRRSEE
jgi:hypothetical protein